MPEKKIAILNIGKVLLGASFTTLAAVGSAIGGVSGNASSAALWAGLSALPAASLSVYSMIADQVSKLRSNGEDNFYIPTPDWWTSDVRSWQNICAEIESHFPAILQNMSEFLRQDQRVKTPEVVQQCFINALTMQHLTWVPDSEERRRVGAIAVLPILQKMKEVLEPVITQIQQEEVFTDIRTLAINTSEAVQILKEMRDAAKPHMLKDEEITLLRQEYCDALYT